MREGVREPQPLPGSSQPQRLLGSTVAAAWGFAYHSVFSQQGFEASPQASAFSLPRLPQAHLGPPHPVHLPSLPSHPSSAMAHQVGLGGGRVERLGTPRDASPPGPGTPLTVLNGPILALDADEDVYAVVTYQLLGTHSSLFDIDNSTGEASAPRWLPRLAWGALWVPLLDLGRPPQCRRSCSSRPTPPYRSPREGRRSQEEARRGCKGPIDAPALSRGREPPPSPSVSSNQTGSSSEAQSHPLVPDRRLSQ